MKNKSFQRLWLTILIAFLLVTVGLILSVYLQQLFMAGLLMLLILVGAAYALVTAYRAGKSLEQAVESTVGELRDSHERLLTVLDSLEALVYVADMQTYEILFVNEYTRGLWGEVMGKTCWQVLQAGQSGPCDFCTNEKLLTPGGEPGEPYRWESQNTVTGRWYEVRDRAIRWVDGRIVRLEIAIDITERKRAEEELKAAHEFQQSIIDGLTEPIMVIGADYQIKLMNRAAREFSYGDLEAVKPIFCFQISHQREMPCIGKGHPCPLEQVRESGQPVTLVHQHFQANGQPRFVEVIASPLRGADGVFQGIIESLRDITGRVVTENTLASPTPAADHPDDELGQFASKVVKSLQDFFGKLPPD